MRFAIVLIIIAALLFILHRQFPYVMSDGDNIMSLIYGVLIALFVGAGIFSQREKLSETMRNLGIWLVLFLLVVLGYSYRDSIMDSRLIAELMPSKPITNSDGEIVIRAGENTHFFVDGMVNGAVVRFMIDTGASDIMLSKPDAIRAGFREADLVFDRPYSTANGVVRGARVTLEALKIGSFVVNDMPASVNGGQMDGSLLGMSFLRLFKEYRVEDGALVLVP